ncbi:MAG: LysM peptidoglycan-binding domain-containing protein [Verrucomicrobiota bacterium]
MVRRQFVGVLSAAAGGLLCDGLGSSLMAAPSRVITVEKGDTLYGLALANRVSVDQLVKTNNLSSTTLRIGQKLSIPRDIATASTAATTKTYLVRKGDTLSRIASRNKISVNSLRRANGLKGNTIYPGNRLKIPAIAKAEKVEPAKVEAVEKIPEKKLVYLGRSKRQVDVSHLASRRWKHIIMHHSGTPTGSGKIFDYYHRRVKRMENGLAYHFVIGNGSESGDGYIEVAERWKRQIQGGHVRSDAYNQNSIGICLVGNFQKSRPTKKQMAAAIELVDYLKKDLLNDRPKLLLHRDIQDTICPGRYFPERSMHKLFG